MNAESTVAAPAVRTQSWPRSGARGGASLLSLLPALHRSLPEMLREVGSALASVDREYADVLADGCAEAVAPAEVALRRLVWGAEQALRGRGEGGAVEPPDPAEPAIDGDGLVWALFEELGREQWRRDRPVGGLLSAYQVGGRAAWRHMSAVAVDLGVPAEDLAALAEQVFALVDRLGSVTITGYVDEQSGSVRTRERLREELAERLLSDRADPEAVAAAARRAGWPLPSRAAVVLLLPDGAGLEPARLDPAWLLLRRESGPALVVPDAAAPGVRRRLSGALRGVAALVGPAVPLERLTESLALAEAALRLPGDGTGPVFVEDRLDALLVHQDGRLLDALRERCLQPLATAAPSSRDALRETLRSWLLHMGNQRAVAAELHVHPQTVRYRLGRLRELFGAELDDPETRRRLFLALAWDGAAPQS